MNKFKRIIKKAPAVIGLVGGLSAQYAALAGSLNPRAGAVLTGAALISAAVGDSIVRVQAAVKQAESQTE